MIFYLNMILAKSRLSNLNPGIINLISKIIYTISIYSNLLLVLIIFDSFEYGIYVYIFALIQLLTLFTNYGFQVLSLREFSKDKNSNSLFVYLRIVFCFSILGFLLMLFLISIKIQNWKLDTYLVYLIPCVFFFNAYPILENFLRARNNVYYLFSNIVFITISLFIKLIIYINAANFEIFLLMLFLDPFMYFVVTLFFVKKQLKVDKKYENKNENYLQSIASSTHFFISSLFIYLYYKVDVFLIEYLIGYEALGNYSKAVFIINIVLIFFTALISGMLPEYYKNKKFLDFRNLLLALFFVMIFMYLVIPSNNFVMRFILLNHESLEVFYIYMLTMPFVLIGSLLNAILHKNNLESAIGRNSILVVIIHIPLSFILIKTYGLIGSCYASVLSFFIASIFLPYIFIDTRRFIVSFFKAVLT